MSGLKAEVQELDRLKDRISDLRADVSETMTRMVAFSSIRVGDTVEVNGYSHTGKHILVDRVFVRENYEGLSFVAKGRVIKKNGEPGEIAATRVEMIRNSRGQWMEGAK